MKNFIYITKKESLGKEIGLEYKKYRRYCEKNRLPLVTITPGEYAHAIEIIAPIKTEEEEELWRDFNDNSFISKILIRMGVIGDNGETCIKPVSLYDVKPEYTETIANAFYDIFLGKRLSVDKTIKSRRMKKPCKELLSLGRFLSLEGWIID